MTVHYSHRGFLLKRNTGGYCEKCERDTPHRNLVCSVCKSTVIGRGENTVNVHVRRKMAKASATHRDYMAGQIWAATINNRMRKAKREAFKDSAAKFRAMFEGEKK